jgi:type II secretion system protein N
VKRALGVAATALVVFGVVLALTFPTDALVRALVARVTPAGTAPIEFARARLRPTGIRLDDVVVRRADGRELVRVEQATLRPSLCGLLRDGTGRPWRAVVAACGGAVDADLAADGAGQVLILAWHAVDLARCPALAMTGEAVAGIAEGTARLSLAPATGTVGIGHLRIRDAAWGTGGRIPGLATLHADAAEVDWSLGAGRVLLDRIDLHGPELSATGSGALALAGTLRRTGLDVALAITPGPAATQTVRDILGGLPPAEGDAAARVLALGGTLGAPRLVH